jgi:hypothetical protein
MSHEMSTVTVADDMAGHSPVGMLAPCSPGFSCTVKVSASLECAALCELSEMMYAIALVYVVRTQTREVLDLGRYGSCQCGSDENKFFQLGTKPNFRGYGAIDCGKAEPKFLESSEVTDTARNGPGDETTLEC